MKSVIYDSISDWLGDHQTLSRLVQMFSWAANHPIISGIILIFALAILWNLIKGIGHLIQLASLSIIRVPLKLLWGLVAVSFVAVGRFVMNRYRVVKQGGIPPEEFEDVAILPQANSSVLKLDNQADSLSEKQINKQINKQVRLVEITSRLEALQKEQKELLQEAAALMVTHQIETTTPANTIFGLKNRN
jgi:hypothetical protein